MNWIKEKERLQDMIINKDLSYEEIGRIYDVTGAAVKKAAQRMCIPLKQRRVKRLMLNPKIGVSVRIAERNFTCITKEKDSVAVNVLENI